MLFYEPLFLFVFFPFVFTIYLLLKRFAGAALGWIAIASCLFYLWSEPVFFWIALASAALDYVLGNRITRNTGGVWLGIGVVSNLLLLGAFKYSGFLTADIANPALMWIGTIQLPIPSLALPIGVSFIVFEKITYLVDIRRGIFTACRKLSKIHLFRLLFP